MRDDLHRGAPVARKWRSMMRAIASNADWRVEGPARARVALVADMRGNISPSVLKEVRDTIESSLPGLREPVHWQHPPRSEVDRLLQGHAQLAILDGRDGPSGTEEVMRNAVEEFAERQVQAMRTHVLTKDRGNAAEFVDRTRETLAPAIQGIVQELALGAVPAKPPAAKPVLDLDEDLRGSRK